MIRWRCAGQPLATPHTASFDHVAFLAQALDFDSDRATRQRSVAAFQSLFLLIVGVEYWCRAIPKWGSLSALYVTALPLATLLCTAGLWPAVRRWATLGLALVHAVVIAAEFPAAGNHAYLELYFCLLIAFVDPEREEEQRLFVMAARWMMVVIFFYSGMQKLVHGYYFAAQYFAFSMTLPSFRDVFQWLVPADEIQRLTHLAGDWGDGPYRSDDLGLRLLTNATWILELTLAPMLLLRATRSLAVAGILALLVGIESGAREVFFGLIFCNGLLLFAPARIHQRVVPAGVVLLLALLLIRLGILPEVTFY